MKFLRHTPLAAITIMRFSIFVGMILSLINGLWQLFFVSSLILILTFSTMLFEKRYRVKLPIEFELLIILFIYASLFLGEVHSYYTLFWWWDVVLHIGSGVVLGFGGFLLLYVLYYQGEITARPEWIAIFAFCFAVAIGALWEIFEFAVDELLGYNMQETGLVDTMWDLIVDSLGAFFVSLLGYFYLKGRRAPLFTRVLETFKQENPHMITQRKKIRKRKIGRKRKSNTRSIEKVRENARETRKRGVVRR